MATMTIYIKVVHGNSRRTRRRTVLREDEGGLLAGASMLKLAGDDTQTHYWRCLCKDFPSDLRLALATRAHSMALVGTVLLRDCDRGESKTVAS